jgi:hypothetical protein
LRNAPSASGVCSAQRNDLAAGELATHRGSASAATTAALSAVIRPWNSLGAHMACQNGRESGQAGLIGGQNPGALASRAGAITA